MADSKLVNPLLLTVMATALFKPIGVIVSGSPSIEFIMERRQIMPNNAKNTSSSVNVLKDDRAAMLANRRATLEMMLALRENAIKNGMNLLTEDEINAEVARRRGQTD